MLRTSNEWCEYLEIDPDDIIDKDGWNRDNLEYSFYEEKISLIEFNRRLMLSTIVREKEKE